VEAAVLELLEAALVVESNWPRYCHHLSSNSWSS
jgi:hypothetical protein